LFKIHNFYYIYEHSKNISNSFNYTKKYILSELIDTILDSLTELAELLGFDANDKLLNDKSHSNYVSICLFKKRKSSI